MARLSIRCVCPGTHSFDAQMAGYLGGCNTGAMSGWSGTIHVKTGEGTTTPNQPPPPQQNTMVWTATGHGTTYNINIDDDRPQTISSQNLPFTHPEVLTAHPGDLFQIVVTGKGDATVGCGTHLQRKSGGLAAGEKLVCQCIWTVPPN